MVFRFLTYIYLWVNSRSCHGSTRSLGNSTFVYFLFIFFIIFNFYFFIFFSKRRLCIFGPKGAIQIRYYYYYYDRPHGAFLAAWACRCVCYHYSLYLYCVCCTLGSGQIKMLCLLLFAQRTMQCTTSLPRFSSFARWRYHQVALHCLLAKWCWFWPSLTQNNRGMIHVPLPIYSGIFTVMKIFIRHTMVAMK